MGEAGTRPGGNKSHKNSVEAKRIGESERGREVGESEPGERRRRRERFLLQFIMHGTIDQMTSSSSLSRYYGHTAGVHYIRGDPIVHCVPFAFVL